MSSHFAWVVQCENFFELGLGCVPWNRSSNLDVVDRIVDGSVFCGVGVAACQSQEPVEAGSVDVGNHLFWLELGVWRQRWCFAGC